MEVKEFFSFINYSGWEYVLELDKFGFVFYFVKVVD